MKHLITQHLLDWNPSFTNEEIAQARNTTKAYVTKVLKRIYDETNTGTRTELLRWAIKTGYVNPKL